MPSVKVFVCRCFVDEDLPDLAKRCNFVFWESYQSQFKNPWASLNSKIVGPNLSTYSARGCRSVSTAKNCGWCNMDFFRTIIWDGKTVNLSVLRSLSLIQKSSTRNRPFFSCRFPAHGLHGLHGLCGFQVTVGSAAEVRAAGHRLYDEALRSRERLEAKRRQQRDAEALEDLQRETWCEMDKKKRLF